MHTYALTDRSNEELRRDLDARFVSERGETAWLVAHIAEFDARELHAEAGYDSMHAYCMAVGRLSEDAAYRRLHAARAARRFPVLFQELADGRLNLSAICLLAPHLTPDNVEECVAAARGRSNTEIRDWLVARMIARSSAAAAAVARPAARQLEVALPTALALTRVEPSEVEPLPVDEPEAAIASPDPGPREFEMRFTIGAEDLERFRYAQALLSHAIPSGDVGAIFRRAIEALITECESRKFGATKEAVAETEVEPRPAPSRKERRTRHIPATVRRAVWMRDRGRCGHVLPSGHRCGARRFLEFDHAVPVARGGPSTIENVRLRCREHNQDAANHVLGAPFMKERRRKEALARTVGQALPGSKVPHRRRVVMKA